MTARVYLITNVLNGKQYVGSTKSSLEARWYHHCYAARRNPKMVLHRAMHAHGEENFKIELLAECTSRENAFELEDELIIGLKTHVSVGGYNVARGRRGGGGMFGKQHTIETRQLMSSVARGRKHSETSKQKMSVQRRGVVRGPYSTSKIIEQIDESGCTVATFRTLNEACSQFAGRGRSHIWECCVGRRKHARGFTWRFKI